MKKSKISQSKDVAGIGKKREEIQKEKLRAKLKACLHEWCNDTTLHGFVNIVKTDSIIIRLIWIVLIITCLAYCIYSNNSIFFEVFLNN